MQPSEIIGPVKTPLNMGGRVRQVVSLMLREAGIGLALLIMCLFFIIFAHNFATLTNLTNIFTQITINTILAVGMTFVILVGGIDLSVGSMLALCAVVAGLVMETPGIAPEIAIVLGILASVGVGMLGGLINGIVSETWKIPSFIVTLGMLNIARGAAEQVTNANTIYQFPQGLSDFGSSTFLGVPLIFVVAVGLVLLGWFVLRRSVFGRFLLAIGNNEEAVRLSGHRTTYYKVAAFVISGLAVGIAAMVYIARLGVASPILGTGFELNAIAAVIIGGTSLSGGKGSTIGTFLGACIIGVLNNGLLLMGVGDFIRQIITGVMIILAVIIDVYRARFSSN